MSLPSRMVFAGCAALLALACMSKPSSNPLQETPVSATSPAASEPVAPSAAPAARAAIGAFGLDLTTVKPDVRPGDDFFDYANGKWLDSFEIPADRSSFGAFNRLEDQSEQRVREIIEQAAAAHAPAGSPEQKIGDYYASFMDQAAIEANGLAPVSADLQLIAAAKSHRQIAKLFGLSGFASLFDIDLPPDLKNPDRYSVVISQSHLGLPDRDYYLKDDPHLQEVRRKYVAYVEQMLTLGGIAEGPAKAAAIMAFETRVAKAQWSIEKRRDVDAVYNPRTKAQLVAYAPGFDWQVFLESSDLGAREHLIVSELTAIRDLAAIFARTPVRTLQAYLQFNYLSDHAPYLPQRFDEARFAFYGKTLRGQPEQRERWKRAVSTVNDALGEQVGQVYVARYFPPESKAKVQQLVANLRASLSERIDALQWMTPQTKARAHRKLATFTTKVGYPDKWKDYSTLEVRREDLIGNVRRASIWQWQYQVARLDKPVDRSEWQMTPQEINAYYNPLNNEIVFPAAILQPPFFDPNADDAVNYGAIGAVIGHEISHGFDDQGSKYDGKGIFQDWWTKEDRAKFDAKTQAIIAQYDAFEPLPGLHVIGANTIGENIADNAGIAIALKAYHISLNGKPAPLISGLSGDQRFYLSFGQVWRIKQRDSSLRTQTLSDPHAPDEFRTIGPTRNQDEWYAAFDVKPGDKYYLPPD